jgi:hypothetical protein
MRTDVGILFIPTSKKVIIANKVVTTDWDIYVPGNVKSVDKHALCPERVWRGVEVARR